jgi:hypothetical protein
MKTADGWDEVMALAEKHELITMAYGGVAILMTHDEQKRRAIFEKTQYMNGRAEHPSKKDER